jgi:hypothetical protein
MRASNLSDEIEGSAWLKLGSFEGTATETGYEKQFYVVQYQLLLEKGKAGTKAVFSHLEVDIIVDQGAADVMFSDKGGCAAPITQATAVSTGGDASDKLDALLSLLSGFKMELTGCRIMSAALRGATDERAVLRLGLSYDKIKINDTAWDVRLGAAG